MRLIHLRARLAFIAILVLLLGSSIPALADDAIDAGIVNTADNETPSNWFVELAAQPMSEGNSATAVQASKDSFKNAAKAKGVKVDERFSYGDLWNGLSVRATAADVAKLQRLPGVTNVWPVVTMRLPDPGPATDEVIDLSTAISMTHADYVQDTLGITGKNVKVAVMDTGIDYDNPDLGGCFGSRCRVFTGWDFVGDDYNADSSSLAYQPVPHPDANPDDCNGHGTHVSGIIGANGVVRGVAPDVRFGAYRVFGCDGSTEADIMLAAMERALADRMDVLNMSIGSSYQWPQYPTAVAADRLVRKHGVAVVASIGNSGATGLYSAGAPGVGEKVIGVASFDNTHLQLPYFTVSPDATAVGWIQATASPAAPTSGSATLARTGTTTSTADACSALPAGSLAGKVALIRRGTCAFNAKAFNAQNAGAIGVILYNNAAGYVNATVVGPPTITIPVVGTSDVFGALLNGRIATGPTTITWTADTAKFASPTGGLTSSFSSYGLAPDLSLKPDLGAPGGNIYSTWPMEKGGHANLSGTSMASPHVAGAIALLMEARPKNVRDIGVEGIRAALQNSADPHLWWGSPGLGFLDNVQRQGAGMLDIRAAIEATAVASPSKLSLGESQAGPQTRTLTLEDLKRDKAHETTYTLSHVPALSTGPDTFVPSFLTGFATVTFSAPTVTVKKNHSASVNVTITANASLPDRSLYGGYIVFSGDDGTTIRVPYSGFKGDYQSIQVLTPAGAIPTAGRQVAWANSGGAIAGSYSNTLLATYQFTMGPKPNPSGFGPATFDDIPYYLVHFNHQSSRATFTAYDAAGNVALGEAMSFSFLGRNSSATSFFAMGWDGSVGPANARTQLPNGTYLLRLTVLRALGDPTNPAHSETISFATVNIARP